MNAIIARGAAVAEPFLWLHLERGALGSQAKVAVFTECGGGCKVMSLKCPSLIDHLLMVQPGSSNPSTFWSGGAELSGGLSSIKNARVSPEPSGHPEDSRA